MIRLICDQELPGQDHRGRLQWRKSEGLSGRFGQGGAPEIALPQRRGRSRRLEITPRQPSWGVGGRSQGQYSIRINDQFRACFVWTAEGPAEVEIVDYH